MKFYLSHVSRGVPQKQLMALKHSGLQDVHVPDLDKTKTRVTPLFFHWACSSVLMSKVCVHHDVCSLGAAGVESYVQCLDLDLD